MHIPLRRAPRGEEKGGAVVLVSLQYQRRSTENVDREGKADEAPGMKEP